MIEKTLDTGKILLNYAESQAPAGKPPLVMLHGGSGRWQLLEELMAVLSQNRAVYAPDLRGHGRSGHAPWGYTVRDYAEDMAAFLARVSGPAYLYGHSLGGIVALMTAGLYPENVLGVLVGDAPLDSASWQAAMRGQLVAQQAWRALSGGSVPVEEILARLPDIPFGAFGPEEAAPKLLSDVFPAGHPILQELALRLYQQDPDVLGMLLDDFDRAAEGYQMEALLPAIRCPVLLMQADPAAGGAMSDSDVEQALRLLRQPAHIKFNGLSHMMNYEDPPAVLREMEAFCR